MFAKKLVATSLAIFVTLGLAACDPPMPPELLAAQAEKTFTCVDGDLTVAAPDIIGDLVDSWSSSISQACAGMTLTKVAATDATAQAQITLDGVLPSDCKPFGSFPIAIDGGVIAYALGAAPNLNLTPQNVQDIFSGKITSWADPSLKAANPDAELPSLPIHIIGAPQQPVIDSLATWFKKSGVAFAPSSVKVAAKDDGTALATMADGDIALTSYSNALYAFSTVAAIKGPQGLSVADSLGMQNGADASYKPRSSTDAPGYAATYPIQLALCGADNQVARAVARFLLRQDAQGALGSAIIAPLPDSLRVSTIALVEKGLAKG
ncbi:MAG: substrate-binding domain-containing protein [Rhodoluna sp.]